MTEPYSDFFKRVTGDDRYEFQQRAFDALARGSNVILQAPTGAGKTRTAIYPFLYHLAHSNAESFPRQCIYSVPMRTLANQFAVEYRRSLPSCIPTQALHAEPQVTIQTGDESGDPTLQGTLIFTTIDQTLSNVLGVPYALSSGRANLNAGGVISSYLVFDEFHLFPPDGAFKTTLQVLRLLKDITPFTLMTATFSSTMLSEMQNLLNAEVVSIADEELGQIPSQRAKVRRFHTVEGLLTADAVLRRHDRRSVAICNTVERAQQLYTDLSRQIGRDRVILLHSRFTREHRNAKERLIRLEFGKDKSTWSNKDLILVATQVIEVGLDITCQNLHTELAPAASIIQRAGRCARFPGEQGDVYVYAVPPDALGLPNYAPYTSKDEQELCVATWKALSERDGMAVDFRAEQEVIDQVHSTADRRLLDQMAQEERQIWTMMERAMALSDTSVRRELIRKIDSRRLLVHENPDTIGDPFACQGFSLWHGTLRGKFKELETWRQEKGLDWALRYPIEVEEGDDTHEPTQYRWVNVSSANDIERAVLFIVHPSLVAYDEDVGFRFTPDGGGYTTESAPLTVERKDVYAYQLQTYAEHVQAMGHLYENVLASRMAYAATRLEKKAHFFPCALDRAARLAIAIHDLGKLDERWQAWARAYQAQIGEPLPDANEMVVHTHKETHEHESMERSMNIRRPPHAAEGAIAGAKVAHYILGQSEGLRRAVITAIARHHSAQTRTFDKYRLHPRAEDALSRALDAVRLDRSAVQYLLTEPPNSILENQMLLLPPDNPDTWWLAYFLIVRALRLADMASSGRVQTAENDGNAQGGVAAMNIGSEEG